MRHREVDRADAERRGPLGEAARETHRRLRTSDDLDLLPGKRPGHAEAERLAHGLLSREAAGVALGRVPTRIAVGALSLGEAAVPEAPVTGERAPDPLDLDQVGADVDAHEMCSSSHSGRWAIEET